MITLALALVLAASAAAHAAPTPVDASKLDPDAMIQVGTMALDQNRADIAERIARSGIASHPAAHGFHVLLAEAIVDHDPVSAFYELQTEIALSGPDSFYGKAAAGDCAFLLDQKRPARREMMAVLDAQQKMDDAPADAVAAFAKIEETRGKNVPLELFRAESLARAGQNAEAAQAYRALLDHAPTFVPAYVELARVEKKLGDAAAAADLVAKARAIDPKSWALR